MKFQADKTQLSLVDQKGIEILGNFVQSNPDMGNIRHYEYLSLLAKMLLGGASKPVDA